MNRFRPSVSSVLPKVASSADMVNGRERGEGSTKVQREEYCYTSR